MPKAMQATTTARRRVLAGLATLGGIPSAAVMHSAAPAAALAPPQLPNPDAELIALCARHPAVIAAVNASHADVETCPAWQAYDASRDAISDIHPATLAGMRAKALAAKAEAVTPDGGEEYRSSVAGAWAWDLVDDLLRLTGGAA